jgi:hypothetical protein
MAETTRRPDWDDRDRLGARGTGGNRIVNAQGL